MQGVTRTASFPPPPADPLEPVFRALADPTRRAILDLLRARRRTTGELSEAFPDLTRFAVMKHLRVLEASGLITTVKDGRQKWNAINAVPLRRLYERWVSRYADLWAAGLTRLQDLVESETAEEDTSMAPVETTAARVAHLRQEIRVEAPVEKVFDAFVRRTSDWFFAGEGPGEHPFRIEPRVGGLFFEDHGDGAGSVLATITHFIPNKRVAMSGEFCCNEACLSNVFFKFKEDAGATVITMSHHMAGEFDDDYYAGFEGGWGSGLEKLKALVEG